MANNHGGPGSKFVSVNLNKLYGQPSHSGGGYGPGVGTNRARPGSAGGGRGMVVLSRNRPLQKVAPKLSVPPPLNLPSLRKEYEKIDSSGAGGGAAGGAGSGSGSRPSSAGVGWTKPGNVALLEKEVSSDIEVSESVNYSKVSGAYMPPSARFGHGDSGLGHRSIVAPVERAMVLRGEDFPSLRAALPTSTGPVQKQKEGCFQKVKQLVNEESSGELTNSSHFNSSAQMQSSHHVANGVSGNSGQSSRPSSARVDHAQKQDDPLPLLWLNPRSDWADDERDTGRGFSGRSGRDQELPKSEMYWDRDFDVSRSSSLPHKPLNNNLSERRGQPIANTLTSEAFKVEPYREINSWRSSSIHKDRPTGTRAINGHNVTGPDVLNNSKYMSSNRDPAYARRDTTQERQAGQRHWNHSMENPRYKNENYQNSTGPKSVFSSGGGKSSFSKSDRSYFDDSFQISSSVYDERDPFTGNLVGVVKKKKDVINQTEFHDPVRESFEAELERVQKMQEMERQRIAEEHERGLEQARREDEERRRVILEEEERRRRMEEEAREAAWIAEQERLDAIQKAEELKIAREEKRRMLLEEERRKQAAKQKLLELEARMAKRNTDIEKGGISVDTGADNEVPVGEKDSYASMDSDVDNWEVSQIMVERITAASSDSSAMDRPFDRLQLSREASSRKDFYGGGYMPSRSPDDGFPHLGERDHRWNSFGDGDSYGRNRDIESELNDNVGWGQGYFSNNTRSPYSERLYMNTESDKINSYGRSRYSMKQPCVLPPPLSVPRSSVRGENEISASSSSLESTARTGNYGGPRDNLQHSDLVDLQQGIAAQSSTARPCSQSSLSVSSPPSSPTHMSLDELDDSGGCSVIPTGGEGKEVVTDKPGVLPTLKSVSNDEDEEWSLENHDEMPEQEEYDEDDGYGEEDEVREGLDDNTNLTQEFQLEEKDPTNVMENLVLGFDEGVEVRIPGDEFEKNLKTDGDTDTVDTPEEISVGAVEKQAAVDEQPQNISKSTSSSLLGDPSAQQTVSSMVEVASNCSSSQSTTPVNLQFGLFSGPTLIPSPVPSIQIGSIQMPLHLHPPVGSLMGHVHPSLPPPPLFQFGQLSYTSPVSHGILIELRNEQNSRMIY